MKPIDFEGSNVVFGKDQPEYLPLPAYKDEDGSVITCWAVSEEEIEIIKKTGKIWISQLTFNNIFQPQAPFVHREYL